jgi:glycosyltransferase involved in cell wall biosynthesis
LRILWLKTELLHPVDKGGKIRTYNMLKELKREHQITYLTLDDGSASDNEAEAAFEYCHKLVRVPHRQHQKFTAAFYGELLINLFAPRPYAINKYESHAMRSEIGKRVGRNEFDVLVCDFLAPAVNVPRQLNCPTVLFEHNVEAMIWKRHYEVQKNPLKRSFLLGQWEKMKRFEGEMCRLFDTVIAVSVEDRLQLQRDYSAQQVFDVPTGVDTAYFSPSGSEKVNPHNLVFTGSMDWLPNEDAIRYFTEEILPLIRKSVPDTSLTVVGRNPYPALVELSKRDSSIVVTGRVDDVRPYIERAAVYIVPLRIGGGTRLKIYEALSMEKPMVSTTIGAEGLPLRNGVELVIADNPEAFAAASVQLLNDPIAARRMGQHAAEKVRSSFGWDGVSQRFAEICELTIRARKGSVINDPMLVAVDEQPVT